MAEETNTSQVAAGGDGPKRNLWSSIRAWPRSRQLALGGVALLCVAFFAFLIFQVGAGEYSLLYANLSDADSSAVVAKLKEQKIPYRLENQGRSILVPMDQVYEVRLQLAGAGLPQGGGVGFEIFDKQSFGMTDFTQKVNYQRALQGELSRTIASLAPVRAARIHLALPEQRLFQEQQKPVTCSVIVSLEPGQTLSEGQAQGVIHLVSASVEGLLPENVTVVDANGRVLSRRAGPGEKGGLEPGMLGFQQALEQRLEERAQSLLDRALGVGNSLVRVTASLDFTKRERVEEVYDPKKTAIRSEQAIEEKSDENQGGKVGGAGVDAEDRSSVSTRSEENVEYEVSKVVSKAEDPVGAIRSLSVAVLVSDRLVPAAEGGQPEYEPRPREELDSIQEMVVNAVGLDTERGDKISVLSRSFEAGLNNIAPAEQTWAGKIRAWWPMLRYVVFLLAGLLGYLLLIRPLLKTLRGESELIEQYKTVEQLESELMAQKQLPGENPEDPTVALRQKILEAKGSPAQIIKIWLKDS